MEHSVTLDLTVPRVVSDNEDCVGFYFTFPFYHMVFDTHLGARHLR